MQESVVSRGLLFLQDNDVMKKFRNKELSVANTPDSIVIRSLRRRFWQAISSDDAETALKIYKASRADWEQLYLEEAELMGKRGAAGPAKQDPNQIKATFTVDSMDHTTTTCTNHCTLSLLQEHLHPSEFFQKDDFKLPHDPYDDHAVPNPNRFSALWKRKPPAEEPLSELTTPLHEAARLGCGALVRLLLAHALVDCNYRNKEDRTALHMVAGGGSKSMPPRKVQTENATTKNEPNKKSGAAKPSQVVSRLLRMSLSRRTIVPEQPRTRRLVDTRMDAALAILSWSNHSGQGPSTNSVDCFGRTALHYAAESGRADLCWAVLSSFGSNLTIVDRQGSTACELAAAEGHLELAAQLEARAVLYMDPYGMDEDLMQGIVEGDGFSRKSLVPPFLWYETLADIEAERRERRELVLERMLKIVKLKQTNARAKKAILKGEGIMGEIMHVGEMDIRDATSSESNFNATVAPTVEENVSLLESLHNTHAEIFLSHYQWDVAKALKAFYENPFGALRYAGISSFKDAKHQPAAASSTENLCLICCDEMDTLRELQSCQHKFCTQCLGEYIADCAKSKSSGLSILCPHHECSAPLSPLEIVQLAPTSEDYDSLLNTANYNFVAASANVKYCPYPNCAGVVKFSPPTYRGDSAIFHNDILQTVGAVCTAMGDLSNDTPLTYEGVGDPAYYQCFVQPKLAHRFCFQCHEPGVHWPLPCSKLAEWKEVIEQNVAEVAKGDNENYNEVAQKLWMKANTRPCPKCKAPIEKDEGCNHMTCRSCRYEFCWICSEDWKLHSSTTGGFFRCNRWVDQKEHEAYDESSRPDPAAALNLTDADLSNPVTMESIYGTAMHESRIAHKRSREVGRFLHYFRRWSAHAESAALESRMRETVAKRLAPVIRAAMEYSDEGQDFNFGGRGLSFVHAAFAELLECRSLLQHSYGFSFLRYKSSNDFKSKLPRSRLTEKVQLEAHQAELEMMTEQISDIVARAHLRATQTQIMFLTNATAQKRKEFSNVMVTILVDEQKQEAKKAEGLSYLAKKSRSHPLWDSLNGSSGDNGDPNTSSEKSSIEDGEAGEVLEAAIRASLVEFMSNAGALDVLDVDNEGSSNRGPSDWSCRACTYVNANGRRCAMCGNSRRFT